MPFQLAAAAAAANTRGDDAAARVRDGRAGNSGKADVDEQRARTEEDATSEGRWCWSARAQGGRNAMLAREEEEEERERNLAVLLVW